MAMINIDGVDLPAPSSFKVSRSDLDSSDTGRNELGQLQRDRIRQGIYKTEQTFKVNSSQLALIQSSIEPERLQVTFPTEIGKITRVMYAGDRNTEMIIYNDNADLIMWNISFNLTEY